MFTIKVGLVTLDCKASLSVERQKLWPLPCLPLTNIWSFFTFSLLWLFSLFSHMYSSVTAITMCTGGMVRWNCLSAEVHPLNTVQYLWTPNEGLLTLDYTVCRLRWWSGNRWWGGDWEPQNGCHFIQGHSGKFRHKQPWTLHMDWNDCWVQNIWGKN